MAKEKTKIVILTEGTDIKQSGNAQQLIMATSQNADIVILPIDVNLEKHRGHMADIILVPRSRLGVEEVRKFAYHASDSGVKQGTILTY